MSEYSIPERSWFFVLRNAVAVRSHVRQLMEDVQLRFRSGNNATFRHAKTNGFQLLVKANEDVGKQIYFYGVYEREESAYFRQELRSDDICVDVGANLGYYSVLFGSIARLGSVHSFEPVSANYHLLALNVLANRLDNVLVNHLALGEWEGTTEIVEAADGAFSSLMDTGRRPVLASASVSLSTLDAYCQHRSLPRVDCLKIDVEGSEHSVIRGASELLSDESRRPRLVMLELFDPMLRKFGSSVDAVTATMRSFGYMPFTWRDGRKHEFNPQGSNYNVFFSLGTTNTKLSSASQ